MELEPPTERCEWTTEQWQRRARHLRDKRVRHDRTCARDCGHVFRCRGDGDGKRPAFACGRYFGACMGGGDDNRCSACWCKRQAHETGRRLLGA